MQATNCVAVARTGEASERMRDSRRRKHCVSAHAVEISTIGGTHTSWAVPVSVYFRYERGGWISSASSE